MKKSLHFIWKWLITPLIGLVIILMAVWAVMAIYFAKSPGLILRITAAVAFVYFNLSVFINSKQRWLFLTFFAGTFIIVLIWWSLIPPSNNRDWAPEMSILSRATFSNNFVTVYNIRNFDYETATKFTSNYYDKTFDLNKVKKIYLGVSYWGTVKRVAHTFLSFEFETGNCIVISIELRREKGETYNPVKGLFKMYEIMYVVADEKDVIRLRTNYTHERVYLYPLNIPPKESEKLLIDILKEVNKLNAKPEFYNTITRNCTVSLIKHFANISKSKMDFYIEYLLNGFLDWRLYENGVIDTKLPPKEAKQAYFISEIAKEYDKDPDFSKKIRSHLSEMSSEKPSSDTSETKTEMKTSTKIGSVKWDPDFTSLEFSFANGALKGRYPDDMTKNTFPPINEPPEIKVEKKWPDVTMNAKWTIDISKLSSEKKDNVLDSILISSCNPNYYKENFPKTIVSTEFILPPEYKKELQDFNYNLAEALRGKTLNYNVVMNAGFGASDYTIKTRIYIGASKDGKTVFYYDRPKEISAHLEVREFILAAHRDGNKIFIEINIFCRCEPSQFIRGTKMNRVENDSRYFIMQMYSQLKQDGSIETQNK